MKVKFMYLSQRSREIILNLLENQNERVSIKELANRYNISERSIRYDLKNIDEFLQQHGLPGLKRDIKIEIMLDTHESLNEEKIINLKNSLNDDDYVFTQEDRKQFIYLQLLKEEYTTIDILAELLKVSRSTVNGDLIKLRNDLRNLGINITYINKKGLRIIGSEESIRRKAFEIIGNEDNYINIFEKDLTKRIKQTSISHISNVKNFFESIVEEVERFTEKTYTEQSYNELINQLIFVIHRIINGKFVEWDFSRAENCLYTKEYSVLEKIASSIEKTFSFKIPIAELCFMTNLFLEGNLLRANEYLSDDWVELHIFVHELIEKISFRLNIDLSKDPNLFDALILHLGPAIRRMENNVKSENQLLGYIKENYQYLYSIVSDALSSLSIEDRYFNFNEDEVGYVTLHVASSLEKLPKINSKLRVLLVCNSGLGTAKLLESRIKRFFDFKIINTVAEREVFDYISGNNIDLIISTIDLNVPIPTLKVSPLLNDQEIREIKHLENEILINKSKIKKYDVEKSAELGGREVEKPMLKDLLTLETVKTKLNVSDWEEAIRVGGELLKNAGYIEESYIEAMINSVKEFGPYIVIAPGIAMPHAKAEHGVKKTGFSLITLKNSVKFGHKKNDPVDIVICLASIDHSTHLRALSDLVNYLNDEKFLGVLKNSTSPEMIINYIKEVDEGELS